MRFLLLILLAACASLPASEAPMRLHVENGSVTDATVELVCETGHKQVVGVVRGLDMRIFSLRQPRCPGSGRFHFRVVGFEDEGPWMTFAPGRRETVGIVGAWSGGIVFGLARPPVQR